jgi:hypothetical protein
VKSDLDVKRPHDAEKKFFLIRLKHDSFGLRMLHLNLVLKVEHCLSNWQLIVCMQKVNLNICEFAV